MLEWEGPTSIALAEKWSNGEGFSTFELKATGTLSQWPARPRETGLDLDLEASYYNRTLVTRSATINWILGSEERVAPQTHQDASFSSNEESATTAYE